VGIVFKNNAKTTLSSAVNNSTTTIPVTDGSVFPAADLAGAGTFFLLTLEEDGNSPANEIVKVTTCSGASGNINLTVVRAQEGTSATAFDSGDKAELRFTSGTIDHIRSDNTVHTNIFTTANASTTAFTLNQAVTDENDLVVFIDGVFQAHNTYTVSGTTLTLATAPASGRVVTAYSIKGLRSATNVAIATMTGDNSDTTLTLPIEPVNENSVQVFFDGVYQNKSTFSVSGTTLTFSTAPPTGVEVEAILLTQTNIDTAAILKDADGDTKVQVEESSDEDKIRFDTAGTQRMEIDNSGNVTLNTGNLVIGTSGKGIDFSATPDTAVAGATSTSELLDNYEEGTWTPVYQSTTNSSNNVTNSRVGYYTRVGNTVYITANLISNDLSGITSTDQVVIGGLPYASSSTTSGNDQAVNVAQYRFLSTTDHTLLIQNNSSDIRITTDGFSAATYATFFQYSNSTSTSLKISAVYQV